MNFKNFPCGYCSEIFGNQQLMVAHIEENHQEQNDSETSEIEDSDSEAFEIVCTDSLETESEIIETFECHPCNLQFKSEAKLLKHIQDSHQNSESRPRPHQCLDCPKSFFTKSDLWSHKRIHSGTKYTCRLCGKKLASSGSLHNHQKSVHEENKQFQCQSCPKKFALKQKLANHVLSEHQGQKPFRCDQCEQGFVHKQSYEAHLRRHEGIVINCQICSKPFHDAGYLKKHLRWHEKVQNRNPKM